MEKIEFQNYGPPGISKEILEVLQDNVEEAIGEKKITELYFRESPQYVTATLNDDITNYDMVIVIGQSTDGYLCYAIIYKPAAGVNICLNANQVNEGQTYNKQAVYKFTAENIIESVQNYEVRNNVPYWGNYIRLKAVLGINW